VKLIRKDLGISAFGIQAFDLPPTVRSRRHSEAGSGQEEFYVHLAGAGWIEVDGEKVDFGPSALIYVTPESVRQPIAGPDGLSYLSVGAPRSGDYRPMGKFG
jgi:hypothetical protein